MYQDISLGQTLLNDYYLSGLISIMKTISYSCETDKKANGQNNNNNKKNPRAYTVCD